MLWTIFVILLIMWLLGFSFHVAGSLIHLLLVIAVVVLIVNLLTGRSSAVRRARPLPQAPRAHLLRLRIGRRRSLPAHIEGGVIAEARLALGGVAAKPWRARAAEAALAGVRPNSEHFRRAAEAALAEARPSGDNAFKIELARRIAVRALALAAAGTPERLPALPGSPFAPIPGGALHG